MGERVKEIMACEKEHVGEVNIGGWKAWMCASVLVCVFGHLLICVCVCMLPSSCVKYLCLWTCVCVSGISSGDLPGCLVFGFLSHEIMIVVEQWLA